MTDSSQEIVQEISQNLRHWIHDVNNALFVTKGFLEEIEIEIKDKNYIQPDYDHENLADMVETLSRNVLKMEANLQKLRKYAKEDIFANAQLSVPEH